LTAVTISLLQLLFLFNFLSHFFLFLYHFLPISVPISHSLVDSISRLFFFLKARSFPRCCSRLAHCFAIFVL